MDSASDSAGATPKKRRRTRKRKGDRAEEPSEKRAPALDPGLKAILDTMQRTQMLMATTMQSFVQSAQMRVPFPTPAVSVAPVGQQTQDPGFPREIQGPGATGPPAEETSMDTGEAPEQPGLPVRSTEGTGVTGTVEGATSSLVGDAPVLTEVGHEPLPGARQEVHDTSLAGPDRSGTLDPVLAESVPAVTGTGLDHSDEQPERTSQIEAALPSLPTPLFPLHSGLDERGEPLSDGEGSLHESLLDEGEDEREERLRRNLERESRPVQGMGSESDEVLADEPAHSAQRQLSFEDSSAPAEVSEPAGLFYSTKESILALLGDTLKAPPLPPTTKRRAMSVYPLESPSVSEQVGSGFPFSAYVDEVYQSLDKELRGSRSPSGVPTQQALKCGKLLRRPRANVARYCVPNEIYDNRATEVDVEWESICKWIPPSPKVPQEVLSRLEEDARAMVIIASFLDVSSAASAEIMQRLFVSQQVPEPVRDWISLNTRLQASRGMAIEHLLRQAITMEANLRLTRRDSCLQVTNLSEGEQRAIRTQPLFSNYLFGGALAPIRDQVVEQRKREQADEANQAILDLARAATKARGQGAKVSGAKDSFAKRRKPRRPRNKKPQKQGSADAPSSGSGKQNRPFRKPGFGKGKRD